MRLSAYRDFHKAVRRIWLLYQATMYSYTNMYEVGRKLLRDPSARDESIQLKRDVKIVKLPWKIVALHARDVYPEMLRSTLLIRLVATFEAFLVDAVYEVSKCSTKPFMHGTRLEFSQEHLLTIDEREGIFNHIVKRTLRTLTGGGLKEIRKFYQNRLGTDIADSQDEITTIDELHDRRHIFVHGAGYADGEYVRKHRRVGIGEGDKISVSESYLATAMDTLNKSALHIKTALESTYPDPPKRRYFNGSVKLPDQPKYLQYIRITPSSSDARQKFKDPMLDLGRGVSLKDIVIWTSDDGQVIEILVAGGRSQMKALYVTLHTAKKGGLIRALESRRLKR